MRFGVKLRREDCAGKEDCAMHDIWNPWHGCVKCSEGCAHCYMYFLDGQRGKNGAYEVGRKLGGDNAIQSCHLCQNHQYQNEDHTLTAD